MFKYIYKRYKVNIIYLYIQMTDNKEILRDDDIIKTEDGLVFNPYNSLNVKITLSEVQSILS